MCRHLAYLGPPIRLRELLSDPPHSLLRQSWAPRRQRHGTVNADGFGVGWYADGDPIPARYRSDRPMWTDRSFADIARVVRSRAVLAAVRSATPGMPYTTGAAAPFAAGRHLFSHNGAVPGWAGELAMITSVDLGSLLRTMSEEAATDSALLWALAQQRLDAGESLPAALASVVRLAASTAGGRLNLLAADGGEIVATAYGDTLTYRADARGVVVASEPYDDEQGWVDVPDRSLLHATPDGVTVSPLPLDVPPEIGP
jgi:gamma-glutamyl hercynylcysteine S-oxide hydrolase